MINSKNSKESTNYRKKEISEKLVFEQGQLPPSAIDIEDAILGAIINNYNLLPQVLFLKPEMFYKECNQLIFTAILQLKSDNIAIELLSVTHKLKTNGNLESVGGAYYITELTTKVPTTGNIQYHARIVYQMYLAREIIRLSYQHSKLAFDSTTDVLELIEQVKNDFSTLESFKHESKVKRVKDMVKQQVEKNLFTNNLILETGWKQFDKMVSIEANKLILWGGSTKDGKSKILVELMKRILRRYADKVFILWCTFEDTGSDVFYNYAAADLHIKPKLIRNNFIAGKEEAMEKVKQEFESYPIYFIEESVKSQYIKEVFVNLANENKGKLPILIVDNILTLSDRTDFKNDLNSMYDFVMDQFHQARNLTGGFVNIVHHYKDSQMDKSRIITGFRPEMTDLKGTEAFRRIPNHVILINNPHKRKELYREYTGKDRELLKHLLLLDVGANRDDSSDDEDALIRMVHNLDYGIFFEI